jgi:hypothetical protein
MHGRELKERATGDFCAVCIFINYAQLYLQMVLKHKFR